MRHRTRPDDPLLLLLAAVVAVGATAQWIGSAVVRTLGLAGGYGRPWMLAAAPAWVAVVALLRARTGRDTGPRAPRMPPWAVPALLGTLLVAVWGALVAAQPYAGHDEAVYAARARAWAGELPPAGWQPYRPLLLPALGVPVVAAGAELTGLRVLSLALTALTLAITYGVGARWSGRGPAAVAVLVVLAGPSFLRRVPEFLNDIPAAGLTLALCALLLRVREGADRRLLVVAGGLAVALFYLRYGALANLGGVALAAVLTFGVRPWLRDGWPLLAGLTVLVVGMTPHLAWSAATTGSPIGVLRRASAVAGQQAYVGEGLVQYAALAPSELAGDLGAVVLTAGVAYVVVVLVRRLGTGAWSGADGRDERWVVLLGLASASQVLLLGLTAHAEARFVFFPLFALTVVGVHGLARLAAGLARPVLAGVVVLALLALTAGAAVQRERSENQASRREPLAVAARLAGSERPCLVLTRPQPQVGWYSGCATRGLQRLSRPLPTDQRVAVVLPADDQAGVAPADVRRAAAGRPVRSHVVPARDGRGTVTVLVVDPLSTG